ncbi:MAG TPA: hypothetical protein VF690_18780 [Hymenobacter sp.]|jgi:hypothetical protein
MTLAAFDLLPEETQLALALTTGTFVATRWQQVDEAVHLYQMPGSFFVEVIYNTTANEVLYPVSFGPDDQDRLDDYAHFVRLPDWLPGTE